MKYWQIMVIITFLWIGFVCAISFMEAWLKFQAPGVSTQTGLSIGRLVFNALNKVEWVMAIALNLTLLIGGDLKEKTTLILLIPVIILVLQTLWLLPALDHHAQLIINGQPAPSSYIHIYYIVAEVIKVIALGLFGIKVFGVYG